MFTVNGVEDAHPGARASRPHKSWHSLGHLLHPGRPATAYMSVHGRMDGLIP